MDGEYVDKHADEAVAWAKKEQNVEFITLQKKNSISGKQS